METKRYVGDGSDGRKLYVYAADLVTAEKTFAAAGLKVHNVMHDDLPWKTEVFENWKAARP